MSADSLSPKDDNLLPKRPRPLVFLCLDGWGISATRENNAIRLAKIPFFKKLVANYPSTVLRGSSLPDSESYALLGSLSKKNNLAQAIAQAGWKQLKIAETEKFPAITSFFNQNDDHLAGEDLELLPSPGFSLSGGNVELATPLVLEKMLEAIKQDKYDFIFSSWPNLELAAASSSLESSIKAVEYLDQSLARLVKAINSKGGVLVLSATSGRGEKLFDIQTNLASKGKTDNPVPFIICGEAFAGQTLGWEEAPKNDLSFLSPQGGLERVAPTIAKLLSLKLSKESQDLSLI